MTNSALILTKSIALIIAAIIAFQAMAREMSRDLDSDALLAVGWVLSPYVVYFVTSYLVERFSSIRGRAFLTCGISVLILLFTFAAYQPSAETSSTDSLVFLFAPFYILVGGPFLLGFCLALMKLLDRDPK